MILTVKTSETFFTHEEVLKHFPDKKNLYDKDYPDTNTPQLNNFFDVAAGSIGPNRFGCHYDGEKCILCGTYVQLQQLEKLLGRNFKKRKP